MATPGQDGRAAGNGAGVAAAAAVGADGDSGSAAATTVAPSLGCVLVLSERCSVVVVVVDGEVVRLGVSCNYCGLLCLDCPSSFFENDCLLSRGCS